MTKQESFKRAVRARMTKTGEKYGAARRALIAGQAQPWVEEPETSDEAVKAGTGRTWDEWCAIIDEWPERADGHAAMARRMGDEHLENGWWAQTVIVGYERIRGLRTKYLRADGTFAGSVTRTIDVDPAELRADLFDPARQAAIVGGGPTTGGAADPAALQVELRSRPSSKRVRWAIDPDHGSPEFSIEARPDGRVRVSIQHESLPSTEAVEAWKKFWADWLASVDRSR